MPSNDSFINANDLAPRELAGMLQNIEANATMYNKYLAYKKREVPKAFIDIAMMSYVHPNVACRLCDYAVSRLRKENVTTLTSNHGANNHVANTRTSTTGGVGATSKTISTKSAIFPANNVSTTSSL